MGLDITLSVDNEKVIFNADYHAAENDHFHKHSLSRTFCGLVSRGDFVEHPSELVQIGEITGVDVRPIYEMLEMPEEESLSFHLRHARNEAEKSQILQKAAADQAKLQGNIDRVLACLNALIEALNAIDDLPARLLPADLDTLDNATYFSDFKVDKGKGYIGNNFGQDLRNFQRFVSYAKERGTQTVWFVYG